MMTQKIISLFVTCLLALTLVACQSVPGALTKQQIRVLQAEGFEYTEDGWAFNLSGKVLFQFDEDSLSDDSRTLIDHLSHTLKEIGIYKIRIEGHTDALGSESYNKALSLRRAEEAAAEFIKAGMLEHNLVVIAHGSSRPVADNATEDGRQQNRRVAIIVIP
ncbi:OmpA family protein [Cellvibrio polysaccharolyticus]|nr:OmpA family protein [Cellvibrio polysaccharolyticus]